MIEKHVFGPVKHGASDRFRRADLEVYGINHFGPSYTALVFFNDPEVDEASAARDRPGYAGTFSIFAHRTCSGGEGHCDVPAERRRFDDRPSHPLTKAFRRVVVTDALRRVRDQGDELTITVVTACHPKIDPDGPLLDIEGMQLATFA
jgi:tyrosinase